MRNQVAMIWKPTGHSFRVDIQRTTFHSFLNAVKQIQLKVGLDPPGAQYVNEQGVHYCISGSKECILTMDEEFEVFVKRIADTRGSAIITIRPVDLIVSPLPGSQLGRFTNTNSPISDHHP